MYVFMFAILSFVGLIFIVIASTTMSMHNQVFQEKPMKYSNETRTVSKYNKGKAKKKEKQITSKPDPRKTAADAKIKEDETRSLDEVLEEIDRNLDSYQEIEICIRRLRALRSKYPQEPGIWWRLGKGYLKFAEKTKDLSSKHFKIDKGISACQVSLDMDSNQSEAHKWMAVLMGYKGHMQPLKEKINCANLLKMHLDQAISLNPSDPVLQHMAGRFCFEMSSLNWFERKIVKAIFTEPSDCSYDKALEHFLECEKLCTPPWKENRLLIAKCYIAIGQNVEALKWLRKAKDTFDELNNERLDREINNFLAQYSDFR
ncbi:hypothetical protein HHI36_021214 [Cryptolaemus montrouzieri]|uniref:Regulator of microtubule dynamics protein 1 n=1 Tax=Cryptolaemus montrouzieri TaxID=559131 RepID=A0ABD2MX33_9CUCU